MGLSSAAQSALLKWINTFPISADIDSIATLSDGIILSKILGDLDSTWAPQALPKAQVLHGVAKGIFRYIRTECEGIDHLLETPGVKELSESSHAGNLFELLTVFLMAAISGPDRTKYVVAITNLEADVQGEIAMIIQQKQKECATGVATSSDNIQDRSASDDMELAFEVRYSSLIKQKKALEKEKENMMKQLADLNNRLETLQDHNQTLRSSLTIAEDQLKGAAKDGDAAGFIKSLESKIRDLEELIANQEGQIEQDRTEKAKLRRDADKLGQVTGRLQQLQDDVTELQQENLELTKKANTVDRFKQKLESQRDLEARNKNLEYEIEDLRSQIRDLEILKRRNQSLEATHIKFQDTLSKREMEIFEISNQRKLLEDENVDFQRRIALLEERKEQDEVVITSLQEQYKVGGLPSIVPTGPVHTTSLEEELDQSESSGNRNDFEVSRLKAEIQILKGNSAAAQENSSLRLQLEDAERTRKQLEAKCQELFDKHVISTQQVAAILDRSPSGLVNVVNVVENALLIGPLEMLTPEYYSSEAFSSLRKQQQSTADELSSTTKRLRDTEAELGKTKRDLLSATTDLSMVSEDDIEALERLKSSHENIYASIETELKTLQTRHKALETDSAQQKAHLIEAILTKDKLMIATREKSDTLTKARPTTLSIPLDDIRDEHQQHMEKMQADLVAAQESIKIKDRTIQDLGVRMMELEAGNNDVQKAALDEENTNLKRENAMMTTAWYDLTSRLQSNNVVLQRKADAPRSWINKQRQAVNSSFRR